MNTAIVDPTVVFSSGPHRGGRHTISAGIEIVNWSRMKLKFRNCPNVEEIHSSTFYSEVEIDSLIVNSRKLKRPMKVVFEQEGEDYIVFNRETGRYGLGEDPFEARKDFESNLLHFYNYLKRNKKKLGPINQPEYEYLRSIF